jgi:predicted dehydrogenase
MIERSRTIPAGKTISTAVIGAGAISKYHLEFLQKHPRVRLIGVCDGSASAADMARETYGVDQSFTDAREMFEQTKPDVVHILTPPSSHSALVEMALSEGCHVICEKPLATSAPEIERLLSLAAAHGKMLFENHNYRFNNVTEQLMAVVSSGAIGPVREIEVRAQFDIRGNGNRFADRNVPSPLHQLPAGAIHDFITHLAYLGLLASPVQSFDTVTAHWSNHGGGDLFRYDDLDALCIGHGPDGPVHLRVRFSCYIKPEELRLSVRGSLGSVSAELMNPQVDIVRPRAAGKQLTPIANQVMNGLNLTATGPRNLYGKVMGKTPYEGLTKFLDRVYGTLLNNDPTPISNDNVIAAARLIDSLVAGQVAGYGTTPVGAGVL